MLFVLMGISSRMQKAVTAMFAQIHETLEQGLNEGWLRY